MTREEASEILSDKEITCLIGKFHGAKEALDVALSALRAPTREQVGKVWGGEWLHDPETGYECCEKCRHTICLNDYLNGNPPPFCEFCGSPLTDEAVEIVMERLEALHETV